MGFFSFGKSKQPETPPGGSPSGGSTPGGSSADSAGATGAFVPQPEKAAKFFDHARMATQTGNHEYALMLYAKGLRLDPSSIQRHEDFYKAAIAFYQAGGKPAGRDQLRELEGPGPIDKFVQAEYAWSRDLLNVDAAFRMLEAAAKASQIEFGCWIAPKLLDFIRKQKRQTKSMWMKAKGLFTDLEAYTEARIAIEEAVRVDPTDTQLAADLKELTARQAIKAGGYDKVQAGDGGFRAFVKDAAKQQQLQDAAAIAGSAETEARNLERAREDFEKNPMSGDAIQRLGTLLKRKGTPEAEDEAHAIYMTGFERLSEYRFRMLAGEIRIAQSRRRLHGLQKRVEAAPDDASVRAEYDAARAEALDLEMHELRERQRNYPTDRSIKAELGRIEFELGHYEDAMAAFQACKEEAKLRIYSTHMLGRCFAAEGWHGEAIGEFREAISGLGVGEGERELPIKYDLMVSLMELARAEKNGAHAREAGEICSAIVRKDISYRDIRQKRKEIDALMKELPA